MFKWLNVIEFINNLVLLLWKHMAIGVLGWLVCNSFSGTKCQQCCLELKLWGYALFLRQQHSEHKSK